jgi:hypothetical protein
MGYWLPAAAANEKGDFRMSRNTKEKLAVIMVGAVLVLLLCSCAGRTVTGTVAWKDAVAQHIVSLEDGRCIEVTEYVYNQVSPGFCYTFGQTKGAVNFDTVEACD